MGIVYYEFAALLIASAVVGAVAVRLRRVNVAFSDAQAPHFLQSLPHARVSWVISTLPQLGVNRAPGVIKRTAEDLDIELIVMGAQGHSELSSLFLGSVSLHVLLEAGTDVLLVRQRGRAR